MTNHSNKPISLYVSDMDGTLMNSQSRPSATTVAILNKLISEHGINFTVATARTPATVVNLMDGMLSSLPYIVMAGAAMWDNARQCYDQVRHIPDDVVREVVDVYVAHGVHPFVYRQEGSKIVAHHSTVMNEQERHFIDERLASPLKRMIVEDSLSATDRTMIIFSMADYATLRAVADEIEAAQIDCNPICYHDIFDVNKGYLEIYSAGTTKAGAVTALAKRIGAERVVVFGDNLNDIPMMQVATHSVAMGNAFPEVKAVASEVIGTNDDDSVARWIEADVRNIFSH